MIARGFRVLAIAAALLVATVAGALVGRAMAAAVLPGLEELSPVADSLVPADAADVRLDDLEGASVANLNIFVTPAPPEAFRAWRVEGRAEEDVARVVGELQGRGWQVVEDEGRSVRLVDGSRTASVHADPPSEVSVSLGHRPRGWFFLPTLTALLGAVAVLVLWRWSRARGRHRRQHP